MSNARWTWEGLQENIEAMELLSPELSEESARLAIEESRQAVQEMKAAYAPHIKSGLLISSLSLEVIHGDGLRGVVVRNTADYAWWFEHGTATRHTLRGFHRGAMPAANVFIPAMQRARFRYELKLSLMLVQKGLKVAA